jgi:hydroxyacylglutathione hydrolase
MARRPYATVLTTARPYASVWSTMEELAPGLLHVPGRPSHAFNVHVAGGVIVDAATRHAARRILRAVRGVEITAHAVTHGHCDHQGASAALTAQLGVPFWGPAGEVAALESGAIGPLGPTTSSPAGS